MLKKILKLEGTKELARKEQQSISGGRAKCKDDEGNCFWYSRYCLEMECRWDPNDLI